MSEALFTTKEQISQATPQVRKWVEELEAARKREKDWRKDAARCIQLYECEKKKEYQFNIIFSNTETLAPALYNNLPRPVVQRRFKDEDPMGRAASDVARRVLEFLLDNDVGGYPSFDKLMSRSVLEALVPGRGVVRFKYEAEFQKFSGEEEPGESAETDGEEEDEAVGDTTTAPATVTYETVCGEVVPWNRFLHGYAKEWEGVPWIAIEHFMTREELEKNFPEVGKEIPLTVESTEVDKLGEEDGVRERESGVKLGHVFEIWDKDDRKVRFLAPALPNGFVKEIDDPLELEGFFPMPEPLTFFSKVSGLTPTTLYSSYEEQARELNSITVRINKIINALKVRGFYDCSIEGMEKVMQAEDNTLIAVENVAALQQGQTLEKAIFLMPLEKLITVLQQLYTQRQQIKQVIYEITGISDILRGASVASETATAQNIKNQWGTLRLKHSQKVVQTYVRDCLRIMAEIALTKLSEKTISAMTGLTYPTEDQQAQAKTVMTQVQMQGVSLSPQQATEFQKILGLPTWRQLLSVLRDDLQRAYRIDIETNSTVDAEATEDKQNMGEFLNAVAQFMNGAAPLVEQGILPFEAAKTILLAVTRRYRFGPEVEEELKKLQPPAPPANTEAQQAELKKQSEQVQAGVEDLQKQKQDFDEYVREQLAKVKESQAELAMEKKFAIQEIDQAKKLAQKELQAQMQLDSQTSEALRSAQEQAQGIKSAAEQEELGKQRKELEIHKQEKQKDTQSTAQMLIEALNAVAAGIATPKTARKMADGSWTTASDTKH